MPKGSLQIDILGTSFSITANEDSKYLERMLGYYKRIVENVSKNATLQNALQTSILSGIMISIGGAVYLSCVSQNLSRLDCQPEYLKTAVFNRLFAEAEIAKFTRAELREYEDSLKAYRDIKNSLDSAEEKGERKKAIEIAKNLLEMGMPIDNIMKATGLSLEEIAKL